MFNKRSFRGTIWKHSKAPSTLRVRALRGAILDKARSCLSGHGVCCLPWLFHTISDFIPELCSASADLSEEDKQTELIPITVQQIYVLSRLGRDAEAATLANELQLDQ
jgi:hypothetical protein